MEYIFSALCASSNPCLGPLTKINFFFLSSIFVEELISISNVIKFMPNPVPGNEKLPCLSNQIKYPEYL